MHKLDEPSTGLNSITVPAWTVKQTTQWSRTLYGVRPCADYSDRCSDITNSHLDGYADSKTQAARISEPSLGNFNMLSNKLAKYALEHHSHTSSMLHLENINPSRPH